MIPLLHTAISERFRGAARQSAIQIHVYFTLLDIRSHFGKGKISRLELGRSGGTELNMLRTAVLEFGQLEMSTQVKHHFLKSVATRGCESACIGCTCLHSPSPRITPVPAIRATDVGRGRTDGSVTHGDAVRSSCRRQRVRSSSLTQG